MKGMDIQLLISRTLRWGVSVATLVAFVGGTLYLLHHGGEAFDLEEYRNFSYDAPHAAEYTTLRGILDGFWAFTPVGWIQTGVLLLILTPILRVALSLVDFLKERDWLYAFITAVVLAVIVANSLGGIK